MTPAGAARLVLNNVDTTKTAVFHCAVVLALAICMTCESSVNFELGQLCFVFLEPGKCTYRNPQNW
jgi:hypothetical protein